MPPVTVHPAARQAMLDLAQRDRRHEACAFLEGEGSFVARIHPTPNVHAEKQTRYAVDPRRYLALEDELEAAGRGLVGVFHSHPASAGVPSATDRAHAQPGWLYLILGFPPERPQGELRAWHLAGTDRASEFVELPVATAEVTA